MLRIAVAATVSLLTFAAVSSEAATPPPQSSRSLDGSGNNQQHPAWGSAGTFYSRVAAPNYADGVGSMVAGPGARYISNRIFNDNGQNIFSENEITQWGWAWGQFIDHDIGLRDETPAENAPIPFNQNDPLESFSQRSRAARVRADTRVSARHASRSTRSAASSTPRRSTASRRAVTTGCARERGCCCRAATCPSPTHAVTSRRRRPWI